MLRLRQSLLCSLTELFRGSSVLVPLERNFSEKILCKGIAVCAGLSEPTRGIIQVARRHCSEVDRTTHEPLCERIILARGFLVPLQSLAGLDGGVASRFVKVSKYDLRGSEPKIGGAVEEFDCVGAAAACVTSLQRIHPLFIQFARIQPRRYRLPVASSATQEDAARYQHQFYESPIPHISAFHFFQEDDGSAPYLVSNDLRPLAGRNSPRLSQVQGAVRD